MWLLRSLRVPDDIIDQSPEYQAQTEYAHEKPDYGQHVWKMVRVPNGTRRLIDTAKGCRPSCLCQLRANNGNKARQQDYCAGNHSHMNAPSFVCRITQKFTRRGRCNGVVSRKTEMRPRSRCNAWFGVLFRKVIGESR